MLETTFVLLILIHKHWVGVTRPLPPGVFPTMTSLKGQVKYRCAAGRFEKRTKAL